MPRPSMGVLVAHERSGATVGALDERGPRASRPPSVSSACAADPVRFSKTRPSVVGDSARFHRAAVIGVDAPTPRSDACGHRCSDRDDEVRRAAARPCSGAAARTSILLLHVLVALKVDQAPAGRRSRSSAGKWCGPPAAPVRVCQLGEEHVATGDSCPPSVTVTSPLRNPVGGCLPVAVRDAAVLVPGVAPLASCRM